MAKNRKSSARKIMPLVTSNVAGAAVISTGLFMAAGHGAPLQLKPVFEPVQLASAQCDIADALCAVEGLVS